MTFSQALSEIIHRDPGMPIVEYKGRIFSKGEYAALSDRTTALLDAAVVEQHMSVGVIVRNRPLHAAAMLGLIANARWLTSIYVIQSPEAIAQEMMESRFAAVIADVQDWTVPVLEAAHAAGALGIQLDHDALDGSIEAQMGRCSGLAHLGEGPFRAVGGEPGLEILSSGTTGKPKRIVFPNRMLVRAVESVSAGREGPIEPDILGWPYGGIGGMCSLVASAMLDRYTCLLEKFNVAEWVDAVERLKPKLVSGVPAMARMILDAGVPREKIESIQYFYGGSAPMTPALQIEFEQTYGIDIIWAYGATEFCGTIISWSPSLRKDYRESKLGSMGKALPGISLRVTDVDTHAELPIGEDGFLEALVPVIGDQWIRTTDIVTIDDDGFVFHKGRGDGAILRGGYKVLPEKVVEALRSHQAVLDAAVIGLPDDRLGSIPVAAVELKSGVDVPTVEDLRDHSRIALTAPQVPARILILPSLPRTTSMKIDLKAVARAFMENA
ncbi:fatty acid--CoA ligase family protein [Sphingobium sp.]|uniref:class I adenylate-forming enzyme family protein n=1 Tax=Sphingobium sp. TaxID=1912891 RepID=UPI002B9199C4|nr:fatty acid--CoA ligase family protein [Sphingobium sp.]HUD93979.1 fatty acid--CoA ligase family protein [Sphingobium sp.]